MKEAKAIILAAGKGNRLSDITKFLPKPLIIINGKAILMHNILKCTEAGIKKIFINLHYRTEDFISFLDGIPAYREMLSFSIEPTLLGTAGALKKLASEFRGTTIVVIYGDNYSDISIEQMIQKHRDVQAEMSIALFGKEDVSQSGVAICDPTGRIVEFIEKPTKEIPEGNWVNAGIYILEDSLLDRIPEGYSDFGLDVIPAWLKAGVKIFGHKLSAKVIAVDTPLMFEEAGASIHSETATRLTETISPPH